MVLSSKLLSVSPELELFSSVHLDTGCEAQTVALITVLNAARLSAEELIRQSHSFLM